MSASAPTDGPGPFGAEEPRPQRLQTCVECGKQVPALIGGSCPDCFIGKTPLLEAPAVLDVELCAHCDARHVGAHWVDPDEGVGLDWIREEASRAAAKPHPRVAGAVLTVEERPQDERNFTHHLTLEGEVEGAPVRFERDVLVRMKRSVCDRCSRMFGGYYAAIIQLRATDRDVTPAEIERAHRLVGDELDRQRATGNREAFLTKSGPVPGGFDYYLGDIEGTRSVARVVADKLGAAVEEHAKLSGRQEGNDIYRVTFRVRIRLFAPGDFALLGEEVVQFQTGTRGRALVVRLADRRTDKVAEEDLKRLGGSEILQEAVLVSQDSAHLQVLDPVSFKTVDIPRPAGFEAPGPDVWVLRHEERLYLPAMAVQFPKRASKGPPKPTRQA